MTATAPTRGEPRGALVPAEAPPDDVDDFVVALLEALRGRVDDAAEAVVDALRSTSSFADLDDDSADIVRETTRELTRTFIVLLHEGRRLSSEEQQTIETHVFDLAARGLTDQELAERLAAGKRRICDFMVELASALPLSPAGMPALGKVLQSSDEFIGDVGAAVARGYRRQREQRVAVEVRARQDLADDLLSASVEVGESLVERGHQLGHELDRPHALLLVVSPTPGASTELVRRLTAAYVDALEGSFEASVRRDPAPHGVVLVPASDGDAWESLRERTSALAAEQGAIVVAAGPVSAPGAASAYRDATACLGLATAIASTGVVRVEDLAVYRLVAAAGGDEARRALNPAFDRLMSLSPARRQPLLDALDALWRHGGRLADASATLGIGDRAVRGRIERLREVTGLDAHDPADRWRLDSIRHAVRLFDVR